MCEAGHDGTAAADRAEDAPDNSVLGPALLEVLDRRRVRLEVLMKQGSLRCLQTKGSTGLAGHSLLQAVPGLPFPCRFCWGHPPAVIHGASYMRPAPTPRCTQARVNKAGKPAQIGNALLHFSFALDRADVLFDVFGSPPQHLAANGEVS